MKSRALLLVAALSLAACQSNVAVEDQNPADSSSSAAMMEATTAFTGQQTVVDEASSSISFVGESSLVDHPGVFHEFTVDLKTDATTPSDLTKAVLTVTVDITSVETDSKGLDGHLQKEDFFDTANHPTANFVSTSITPKSANMYTITGNMTAKGVTKTLSMDAEITDEGITSSFSFPRKEFGVGNDSYGDKLLAAQVPVTLSVVFE